MKAIISWFLVSSANHDKMSRTVKSLLLAAGPFVIWYFQISETEWVQVSSLVSAIVSSVFALVFLVIKLVNAFFALQDGGDAIN